MILIVTFRKFAKAPYMYTDKPIIVRKFVGRLKFDQYFVFEVRGTVFFFNLLQFVAAQCEA